MAPRAFPTPSRGIVVVRGPSQHLHVCGQNFLGSFDSLADINVMSISTYEALRPALDSIGCHLRSYPIAVGGF